MKISTSGRNVLRAKQRLKAQESEFALLRGFSRGLKHVHDYSIDIDNEALTWSGKRTPQLSPVDEATASGVHEFMLALVRKNKKGYVLFEELKDDWFEKDNADLADSLPLKLANTHGPRYYILSFIKRTMSHKWKEGKVNTTTNENAYKPI